MDESIIVQHKLPYHIFIRVAECKVLKFKAASATETIEWTSIIKLQIGEQLLDQEVEEIASRNKKIEFNICPDETDLVEWIDEFKEEEVQEMVVMESTSKKKRRKRRRKSKQLEPENINVDNSIVSELTPIICTSEEPKVRDRVTKGRRRKRAKRRASHEVSLPFTITSKRMKRSYSADASGHQKLSDRKKEALLFVESVTPRESSTKKSKRKSEKKHSSRHKTKKIQRSVDDLEAHDKPPSSKSKKTKLTWSETITTNEPIVESIKTNKKTKSSSDQDAPGRSKQSTFGNRLHSRSLEDCTIIINKSKSSNNPIDRRKT